MPWTHLAWWICWNAFVMDTDEGTYPTYAELKTYKVVELRKFVGQFQDLKTSVNKEELLSIAHAAVLLKLPKRKTASETAIQNRKDYELLLQDSKTGQILPDPKDECKVFNWIGEKNGVKLWPPVFLSDITLFLMKAQPGTSSLEHRLLNEYKQGKAYR